MTRTQPRPIMLVALICALILPLALGACNRKAAAPAGDTEEIGESEGPAIEEDAGSEELDEVQGEDSQDQEDSSAPIEDEVAPSSIAPEEWVQNACALLAVYPATYQRVEGADEPVVLTVEEWAQTCLRYVDPSSELGQTLQNDPESIFIPVGYIEAAVVVNGAEVVEGESDALVMEVQLEGTQQDWEHTTIYNEIYRVQFNSDNLITAVERI